MKIIQSILIANRGEIASRIIRTCKKMGIRSVAVFSDADQQAPYVSEADIAVHIGESAPAASYLDMDKIIKVAKDNKADAIHPGFGFLAENAEFARKVIKADVVWIGPHPKAIDAMGSKSEAKLLMKKHDVPVIPGYEGKDQSEGTLLEEAQKIGFPLLLKAVAGGGGKGMKIVHETAELKDAIASAKREAASAFGNDELIIEKYFSSSRHIEFQILGDKHKHAIHILERECSIQRRYQKIVEESPSPVLTNEMRNEMGIAAVNAAKALDYDNAGTVEFILTDENKFYFLEVNTRLQVEHPVTEEITGLDLVELQIQMAEGQKLSLKQEDIKANGYAIECRLYAEDPQNDFLPATGKILDWYTVDMPGVRYETGIKSGNEISIYYDPMIAKIIAHGKDRFEAIRKMRHVLSGLRCLGLTTNQQFLKDLMQHDLFIKGEYDTHFIKKHPDLITSNNHQNGILHACIATWLSRWVKREAKRNILKALASGWRSNFYKNQVEIYSCQDEDIELGYRFMGNHFQLQIGEKEHVVKLIESLGNEIAYELDGVRYLAFVCNEGNQFFIHNAECGSKSIKLKDRFPEQEVEAVKGGYNAPMPAKVVKILVSPGQKVKSGEGLLIISSMKMENTIEADEDGQVEEVFVNEGDNIEAGMLMLKIE